MGLKKNILTLFIIVLTAVVAYLGVHVYSKITATRRGYTTPTGSDTQKIPAFEKKTHSSDFRRRFTTDGSVLDKPKAGAAQSDRIKPMALKRANLPLRLLGTITGDNNSAYAIIEDKTTRRQKLYKKGDELQNAIVETIFRDKVVIKIGDNFEILAIDSDRPDVNMQDEYGVTALMDASSKGQKDLVELLILEGADLNARDNQENTALMLAALKGHVEIVELLVSNGAGVSLKDKTGNTALIESAKYARKSACEIITLLKENGARVNAKNKYGLTAVIFAAQGGHAENVACLIAAGADLNAKSRSGETALKLAEISGHKHILDLLKDNGARE